MSNNFIENNDQHNAGYLFYKEYFKALPEVDKLDFEKVNKELSKIKVREVTPPRFKNNSQSITFQTTYPGLLIGSGYIHDTNSDVLEGQKCKDDAYKIGFFFDHVSGMPLIPGSSIKGMLRSFFPNKYKANNVSDAYRERRIKFIKSILKIEETEIDELEEQIFSGILSDSSRQGTYKRDVFFDATPVKGDRLFYSDYITPHIDKDGNPAPLKNPTPIKFLKVAPQVEYCFTFRLNDSKLASGVNITKESKLNLFQTIIEYAGLGAKTNVGYGQFVETEEQIRKREDNEAIVKAEKDKRDRLQLIVLRKEQEKKVNEKREEKKRKQKAEAERIATEKKIAEQENRKNRKSKIQENGISELLLNKDIEELLKALPRWVRDYHGKNNLEKDKYLSGKLIPNEYHADFITHINNIYKANIDNKRFNKIWSKNLKKLQKYLADIPLGN